MERFAEIVRLEKMDRERGVERKERSECLWNGELNMIY
jgi:hypothetical protein